METEVGLNQGQDGIFNFVKEGASKVYSVLYEEWVFLQGGKEPVSPLWERLLSSWCLQILALIACAYLGYRWVYLPFFQDFLMAERCRIKLENAEPIKVGDSIVYSISGFLYAHPSLDWVAMEVLTTKFFNSLTAKVTMKDVRIPAMKALAEEDCGILRVIFTADKSGTYQLELRYNGFLVPGCPLELIVPPDFMCTLETDVVFPSNPIILTDGMPQIVEIYPKDRTGYPCSWEGVRLDKFDFHASTENSASGESLFYGKTIELIGDFWKEGLDANYSYDGSCVGDDRTGKPVKVLLTLRPNCSPNSHGIFDGKISYEGHVMKNGCFPIVSLSPDEYERLEPSMTEPKPTDMIQLRAQLLEMVENGINEENGNSLLEWHHPATQTKDNNNPLITDVKVKEVFVNVSLKFICIKEVVWTVILARTALFSVQGDIKVDAIPESEAKQQYFVSILDKEQNHSVKLLMSASNARMLMALFLKFRGNKQGGTLSFHEKSDHFFQRVKDHVTNLVQLNKEKFQLINVSRPDILRTSYEETKRFQRCNWYSPFVVSFLREPLLEDSTSWLEWSQLILDSILNVNPQGMFHIISDKSGFSHPNPSRSHRRWSTQYYELAGKILGKYLVEKALDSDATFRVKVRFSRSFLLQLIGSPPTANSLERDMPELFESTLKSLNQVNQQEDGGLTFCVPLYDIFGNLDQMVPIIENGEMIHVTSENTEFYLNALARYHLSSKVSRELLAFRSGFTHVIPEDFLLNFDENELELLLCGWSKLELNEVKQNLQIVGEQWHPEFPRIVKWLWSSLSIMSSVDQARFLQFTTGSSILPEGSTLTLTLTMTCLYGQLPVADPASHTICLSDHPNYEAFDESLLTALRTSTCCQGKPRQMWSESSEDIRSQNNNKKDSDHF